MKPIRTGMATALAAAFMLSMPLIAGADESLQRQLLALDPHQLGELAAQRGNPARGARLFHSPQLGCAACHAVEAQPGGATLGPHLALWDRQVDDGYLVDAVLRPSKHIQPTYRTSRVLLGDGRVVVGIVRPSGSGDPDELLVQTGPTPSESIAVSPDEIEQRSDTGVSLMPAGQIQALEDVGQFADLISYLIQLRDGGVIAARVLRPDPETVRLRLPEYEARIDHAGMIAQLDDEAFDRGQAIYESLCQNCHGTRKRPGSLPTAPRFATSKLKRPVDPYSLYRTLTDGSGLMLPQTWMVPRQKYDVAHYLREHFFRGRDDVQFADVTPEYLESLPSGDTFGPKPKRYEPWRTMDYGSMMMTTLEVGRGGENIAQKGIALRFDPGPGGIAAGKHWILYEHDTMRVAAVWSGEGFIDWHGIQFDGRHAVHPRIVGDVWFETETGPGWANPKTGSLADSSRVSGRDGRRYGPLPADWARFHGVHRDGNRVTLEYSVGDTAVRERPLLLESTKPDDSSARPTPAAVVRSLRLEAHRLPLRLLACTLPKDVETTVEAQRVHVTHADGTSSLWGVAGDAADVTWKVDGRNLVLNIPARDTARSLQLFTTRPGESSDQWLAEAERLERDVERAAQEARQPAEETDSLDAPFKTLSLATEAEVWFDDGTWAVDELKLPVDNPWRARIRVTGIDFTDDGKTLAVCTWDGDVWRVEGLESLSTSSPRLRWQRVATGLFQPLGIMITPDGWMVTCRDQLMRLSDLDGDHVMDHYECFNSDHQVTEHFHEFAMGLKRDDEGNWYYAKSARHALPAVVPHHGTLLRVSPDGSRTEVVATGFRAANGVCLNPDGTFIVTDQEGHWNPKNRINWVREGGFYGNMFGYHDVTDASDEAMDPPLCWITNRFDRSPAELLWVPEGHWGDLAGSLLNLSYGYGRVYVVPHEFVGDQPQGGMSPLPIPDLPTGIIRGAFSPHDGQLYVGGLFAWASSRQDADGGLYRIRRGDNPDSLPTQVHVADDALELTFSSPLDPRRIGETERYRVRAWDLRRTANYGSDHYRERDWPVTRATLQPDGRTLRLELPDLSPTWCFSLQADVPIAGGGQRPLEFHGTIHAESP